MTRASVHFAASAADFGAARALCLEWLDWHWRNYPDGWPQGPDHPMNPDSFTASLADMPRRYARPRGGVLLGRVDGLVSACVMYHEARPGVAEFNRMFVSEAGRGHGLGRRMLDRMLRQMRDDGYGKVFFSSATFLTHARAMYEAAGFVAMPQPQDFPDAMRAYVYFMERRL